MVQYYWNPAYQNQYVTPPTMVPSTEGRPPGNGLPAGERSYIENILRLNIGNPGTFNFSFEHAVRSGFNTLAVTGVVEQAGRDHVIIKEESTGHSYLFPMIYFDFAEFQDGVNYFPQQPQQQQQQQQQQQRDNQECKKSSASLMWAAEDFFAEN